LNLLNNYFLLYHGKNIKENEVLLLNSNLDNFYTICPLILCIKRNNYDKYINLDSFKNILLSICKNKINNINELFSLQYSILSFFQDDKFLNKQEILKTFSYLYHEKIIKNDDYKKLISLFEMKNCETNNIIIPDINNISNKQMFAKYTIQLHLLIDQLNTIFDNISYKNDLKQIQANFNNKEFSIGITGVMNAGKSTMLNALMGKEVLGSSIIPETANLTIIKYGKPKANVFYWNTDEWNNIQKQIPQFVEDTKNNFGDDLSKYIKDKRSSIKVDINNLSNYTSANTKNKTCNLVKYVELNYNINFLKDGISIVDTPGLDDPVIQREEITKEYLKRCDMMFHLMNVSQSATLKDIEFIIDALLYQNITKLLIVITRCDMVDKNQLNEVIKYTKNSIKKQLKIQNKQNKLNYILEHIQFIAISSKMALLHRTNQSDEALKLGYTLEDSGILNIEKYINDTLYSDKSSKSQLLIISSKLALNKVIEKQNKSYIYEIELLNLSKNDLIQKIEEFNIYKKTNEQNISKITQDISIYKSDAKNYIDTLNTFIDSYLVELQELIKQRVYSEIKYSYEKEKEKSNINIVKSIIKTALKDAMVDLIREYKYKFIKKTQYFKDNCIQKYKNVGFDIEVSNINFNNEFNKIYISISSETLISKILKEHTVLKSNKLDIFYNNISLHIKDEFIQIKKSVLNTTQKLSVSLINMFFNDLKIPLNNIKEKLNNDEEILNSTLKIFEKNEKNRVDTIIQLHNKIDKLQTLQKRLNI
jgi:predicted GTPase